MTNSEKITIIANQLANDGKKPTVALVKGRLSDPVPLPQIIGTLKSWTHEPDNCLFSAQNITENSTKKENTNSNDVFTQEQLDLSIKLAIEKVLIEEVAPLKAELAEIKALLKNINNSNILKN